MGTGGVQTDENLGDIMPSIDEHGTRRADLHGPGRQVLDQLWLMRDLRSGSPQVASARSGFRVVREVVRDPADASCLRLIVEKTGAAVSVGGRSTEAGGTRGKVRAEWRFDCKPPPGKPPGPTEKPPGPTPQPTPEKQPQQQPPPVEPGDLDPITARKIMPFTSYLDVSKMTGPLPVGDVIFDSDVTPNMMALLDQAMIRRAGQALDELADIWKQALEELE